MFLSKLLSFWLDSSVLTTKAVADSPCDYFKAEITGCGKTIYPIVYHPNYDVRLFGFERLHIYDTLKWRKTYELIKAHFKNDFIFMSPLKEVDRDVLLLQHSEKYVQNIHNNSITVARIAESRFLYWIPKFIIRSKILEPFKWQTSGTILASRLAMVHGAAVNLGGGFHHASRGLSTGFCFFADIDIAINYLWKYVREDLKFLIIDLDAHQGNGHELSKSGLNPSRRRRILTFDMYNKDIFPRDFEAEEFINFDVKIGSGISDDEYLDKLKRAMEKIKADIEKFKPDLVIYNAGTSILEGDPFGKLNVTEKGVIQRDEFVFRFCRDSGLPVVYLMSGGQGSSAKTVKSSISNLIGLGLLKPINDLSLRLTKYTAHQVKACIRI